MSDEEEMKEVRTRTFPAKGEKKAKKSSRKKLDLEVDEAEEAAEAAKDKELLLGLVGPEKLAEYGVGAPGARLSGVKTLTGKKRLASRRRREEESKRAAARTELLETGSGSAFVETEDGEAVWRVSQAQLRDAVDVQSAAKSFSLDLERTGPWRVSYSRNGRHLLLGGRRGHLAQLDWHSKALCHETSVGESIRDVQHLHLHSLYAVAQEKWTYIYDAQGTELHCLRHLHDVRTLTFLPYHFLLVAGSGTSYLHWTDVSMGKAVASFATREGPLDVLCQNPANAVVHCGHAKGTVSLWSPNSNEALVKMVAHGGPVRGLAVDATGKLMATSGQDGKLRIWDLRTYKPLSSSKLPSAGLGPLALSAKGVLALANGDAVQLFNDLNSQQPKLYLQQRIDETVTDVEFAPFEDVLGVGHGGGFTSLLVPGSGEARVDALEANPYQTKAQRREWEVKALLDKIQPELIGLDSSVIGEMDRRGLSQSLEERAQLHFLKPSDTRWQPKHKKKGRGKIGAVQKRKELVRSQQRREEIDKERKLQEQLFAPKTPAPPKPASLLDRFRSKS